MLTLDIALTEKGEAPPYPEVNRSTKKVKIRLEENHSLIPDEKLLMEEVMVEGDIETEEVSLCLEASRSRRNGATQPSAYCLAFEAGE